MVSSLSFTSQPHQPNLTPFFLSLENKQANLIKLKKNESLFLLSVTIINTKTQETPSNCRKAKSTKNMYIYSNFVPQLEGKKIKVSWEKDIIGAKHSLGLRPVSQLRCIPPRMLTCRLIKARLLLPFLIAALETWCTYGYSICLYTAPHFSSQRNGHINECDSQFSIRSSWKCNIKFALRISALCSTI